MTRTAQQTRNTKETQIEATVTLEGSGQANIDLPLPFFVHMLEAFIKYSGMDVTIKGTGDIEVDAHHLVEDVGITLGATIAEALGDRRGIRRFGDAYAPLDESLVRCVLDYSNRPHVVYNMEAMRGRINDFDLSLLQEFIRGYAQAAGISMHMDYIRGENLHHIAEAAFKSLGLATREALAVIGTSIPSTKGVL